MGIVKKKKTTVTPKREVELLHPDGFGTITCTFGSGIGYVQKD